MAKKKETEKEVETPIVVKEEVVEEQDIKVESPMNLKTELPLVVKLPKDASKAQIEFAKTLNVYAYKNPAKWEVKKERLIKKLRSLKDAPDPIEGNLKYGTTLSV